MFHSFPAQAEQLLDQLETPMLIVNTAGSLAKHLDNILAEGAIALSVTLSGGVLFAS